MQDVPSGAPNYRSSVPFYASHLPAQEIFPRYSGNSQACGIAKGEDLFDVPFSLRGLPVMDKFVGRDTELTRLAQLIIASSTDDIHRKVCVLHGIGGVCSKVSKKLPRNFLDCR